MLLAGDMLKAPSPCSLAGVTWQGRWTFIHDHAAILKPLPDPLEPRRFFVARRIAPGSPEVHNEDLPTKRPRVKKPAVKLPQPEIWDGPAGQWGWNRTRVPGEPKRQDARDRDRHYDSGEQKAEV